MKRLDTVVIGGGLAGISCAINLSEAGENVMLLEARDVMGGRTSSWDDNGMEVESGLHRYLGFYKHLPALVRKADVNIDDIIGWEDEIEIRLPDNTGSATFGAAPIYKPVKTLASIIGNNSFVSVKDKLKLAKIFATGLTQQRKAPIKLDSQSVADQAKRYKLSPDTIERMLTPFTDGIFFLPPRKHSAYPFFKLVGKALKRLHRMRVGVFMGGMSKVMINPLVKYFEKLGGEVVTGTEVLSINQRKNDSWLIKTQWATIKARNVVVATSLKPAQDLLHPLYGNHPWFHGLFALKSHPAVTMQLSLDSPTRNLDRTTFTPMTSIACFAEQSRTTFRHEKGRLSIIMSDPKSHLDKSAESLLDECLSECRRLGLQINKVLDYRKIVHAHDFYELSPHMETNRPKQKTPVPGLYLAGDYTQQPFFATMEGAVLSGKLAAEQLLQH